MKSKNKSAKNNVDIVVPVYNEAETLEHNTSQIVQYLESEITNKCVLTIAINGSTDDSLNIANDLEKKYECVRVLETKEPGRGGAISSAWKNSKADILIYTDEDLSTQLSAIKETIEILSQEHYDLVVGSRLKRKSRVKGRSLKRKVITRIYSRLVITILRTPIKDYQCGFKAIRKDSFEEIESNIKDTKWFFDTELISQAHQQKLEIYELPVTWTESATVSSVKLLETIRAMIVGLKRLHVDRIVQARKEIFIKILFVVAVSLIFGFNFTRNARSNTYYSMATQAASVSWKAFFFGSLDAPNHISLDKFPFAVWPSALLTKAIGLNSISILLPHMLAGILSSYLLLKMVQKKFGLTSGVIAGTVFALTPICAVMFNFNNPDTFLTLFMITSAYFFMKYFESARLKHLMLATIFIGLAFQAKMLQALVLLPIFVALLLIAPKIDFKKRLRHVGAASLLGSILVLIVPIIYSIVPANQRPYIGSTGTQNSIWTLLFHYNTIDRLASSENSNGGAILGSTYGGQSGFLRMFNSAFGVNIAWLILPSLTVALCFLWLHRKQDSQKQQRAQVILWLSWLILHACIFSFSKGVIHPYYVLIIAPSLATLTGIGFSMIVDDYADRQKRNVVRFIISLSLLISTVAILPGILNPYPKWYPGIVKVIIFAAIAGGAIYVYGEIKQINKIQLFGILTLFLSLMIAPVLSTIDTKTSIYVGYMPTASPVPSDQNNLPKVGELPNSIKEFFKDKKNSGTWLAGAKSSFDAAPLQLETQEPVMAVGGFAGNDRAITLKDFQVKAKNKEITYYISSQPVSTIFKTEHKSSTDEIDRWAQTKGKLCIDEGKWSVFALPGNECGR